MKSQFLLRTINQFPKRIYYNHKKTALMNFLLSGFILALIACVNAQKSVGNLRFLQGDNCAVSDSNGNCTQCYYRYVLIDGKCVAVSDQCNTWDSSTGACTSCYGGYSLVDG